MQFTDFSLDQRLLSALTKAGYTAPTPIQQAAIPFGISGQDVIASAPTGSGKTAAFLLPALNRLAQNPIPVTTAKNDGEQTGSGSRNRRRSRGNDQPRRAPKVLVLCPTRELAQQIETAARLYAANIPGLRCTTIVGGMPYPPQLRALSGALDVLIATPGRLIDHLESGRADLSEVEYLVFDEADRMLDMGFIDDIEHICSALPVARQTMLFSATLDGGVAKLAMRWLKDPQRITIEREKENLTQIEQRVYLSDNSSHKKSMLMRLLEEEDIGQAIIFTSTRRDAESLCDELRAEQIRADALHGNMQQRARTRTLDRLRTGQTQLLIATDVAARGIDVNGITHVFNFALPRSAEDYVHRIGRTGRAGRSGVAISFVDRDDWNLLCRIERLIEQTPEHVTLEGLEPRFTAPAKSTRGNGKGQGRNRNGGGGQGYSNRGSGGGYSRSYGGRNQNSQRNSRYGNEQRTATGEARRSNGGGGYQGEQRAAAGDGRRSHGGYQGEQRRNSEGYANAYRPEGEYRPRRPRDGEVRGASAPRSRTNNSAPRSQPFNRNNDVFAQEPPRRSRRTSSSSYR